MQQDIQRDRNRLGKLVRPVVDCPMDSGQEVGENRMWADLTLIMTHATHPPQGTAWGPKRLLKPQTVTPPEQEGALAQVRNKTLVFRSCPWRQMWQK